MLCRASRAFAVASRSFRLPVPILAIAVETCFQQNLAALASPNLLDRSTIKNKRISPWNPHHISKRSPKNLCSFSGGRSFRFSGRSIVLEVYLLLTMSGPLQDPKASCATFLHSLHALPRSLAAHDDAHLQTIKGHYITFSKLPGMPRTLIAPSKPLSDVELRARGLRPSRHKRTGGLAA